MPTSLYDYLNPNHFNRIKTPIRLPIRSAFSAVGFDLGLQDSLQKVPNLSLPAKMVNAVPKRQVEFLLGRLLAGQLISEFGVEGAFVGQKDRKPVWPKGFVGSITHTENLAAALVLRESDAVGVGLDCEVVMEDDKFHKIKSHILTPNGEKYLTKEPSLAPSAVGAKGAKGAKGAIGALGTLIFSAKESLYKCLNPLTEVFFGFKEAELVKIDRQTLSLRLLKNLSKDYKKGATFSISYTFFENKVFTHLVLPA